MLYSILSYILMPSLIAHIVTCQAPAWQSPTDGSSFTLDISLATSCTADENVAGDDYLSALSSGDTVYYRKVSESPDDSAFSVTDHFSSEKMIKCEKNNIKTSQYQVILGAYYDPRSDSNEATITVTINVQGLPEPAATETTASVATVTTASPVTTTSAATVTTASATTAAVAIVTTAFNLGIFIRNLMLNI